jgi:tetratricopeptide (TPR) repeat protein
VLAGIVSTSSMARAAEDGRASGAPADSLPNIDTLWDFDDPEASLASFQSLVPEARRSGDPDYLAQLLTQVARAQGLTGDFEAAHLTLDEVDEMLRATMSVARVRSILERGRLLNSSERPAEAKPLFIEAWEGARAIGDDRLAVDAAHMVAIAEGNLGDQEAAQAWNLEALALAESSSQPGAGRWRGSLYNNIGWTYHDSGRYDEALAMFEKAHSWHRDQGNARRTRIAAWCVARTLRSLDRIDEALAIQQRLEKEWDEAGEADGYVYEEIGECLLAKGETQAARPYFTLAYEELAKDAWMREHEAERLQRLRELGAGDAAAER